MYAKYFGTKYKSKYMYFKKFKHKFKYPESCTQVQVHVLDPNPAGPKVLALLFLVWAPQSSCSSISGLGIPKFLFFYFWFLASWTEFLGGILLLLGLGTRLVAIPLAVTMFVAAYAVHLDNGWPAIAPSSPPAICIPDTETHANSSVLARYIKCYNVNERTIEAAKRLERAKSILREHGNFSYLNGSGSIVKLNSGIEFAAIYLAMLLALVVIGGGRYLSLDYFLRILLAPRGG